MPANGTPQFISDSLKFGIKLGLERMSVLLSRLDNPQDSLRYIHIAGTNGKGSVAAYCAYSLVNAGYRTGLFTSPFLVDFSERIRVMTEEDTEGNIPAKDVARLTEKVREAAKTLIDSGDPPTEFEIVTAICFLWFEEQGVEVAVMETGLGGRYDSTNLIEHPEVTVITAIGKDHEDRLGDTVAKIAYEKAGIIKQACPVVCMSPDLMMTLSSDEKEDVKKVMGDVASDKGSGIFFTGDKELLESCRMDETGLMSFVFEGREYKTRLNGIHQAANASLAIKALKIMGLDEDTIAGGILDTCWNCRFEIFKTDPVVIFDGGHNPQGASSFADSYNRVLAGSLKGRPLRMLIGAMADKDIDGIIKAYFDAGLDIKEFFCVRPDNPRSISPFELSKKINFVYNSSDMILCDDRYMGLEDSYHRSCGDGMPLVVTGSLYLVGDLRSHMKGID